MTPKMELGARRTDLDWLRVIIILFVFLLHSVHFFDPDDWSVKNAITYPWIAPWMDLAQIWMMPLMFIISGGAAFYASRKGTAAGFVKDKVMRLLVPLLLGVFTFSIIQVYVERVSKNQFAGTFFEFLPHYFDGLYMPGGNGNFAYHGMHLWYLVVLFIFLLLLVPLFWWFRTSGGDRILKAAGDLFALPGALVLLVVPSILIRSITMSGAFGGDMALGSWRPLHYLWFLLAGYLVASHEGLISRIIQARWVGLVVTLLMITLSVAMDIPLGQYRFIAVWPGIVTVLGFAAKHLTVPDPFLTYATDAVLPFYILHQNVILWLGFFVVTWPVPDVVKFAIITASSFVITMVAYEYAIRRVPLLRVLFGMKTQRPAVRHTAGAPVTQPAG